MLEDKKVSLKKTQNVTLENRQKLHISGVNAVDSFNDEIIVVETELGLLLVRGNNLKIQKLNLDNAELNVEGEISSCEYNNSIGGKQTTSGFFSKLFS